MVARAMVDMTHETSETPETPETGGGTAVLPAPPRVRQLPPWRVLLHNDDVSDMVQVVLAIQELTAVPREEAMLRMLEAHTDGVALLLCTHRERAELLQEQFQTKRLTVTIEPDR